MDRSNRRLVWLAPSSSFGAMSLRQLSGYRRTAGDPASLVGRGSVSNRFIFTAAVHTARKASRQSQAMSVVERHIPIQSYERLDRNTTSRGRSKPEADSISATPALLSTEHRVSEGAANTGRKQRRNHWRFRDTYGNDNISGGTIQRLPGVRIIFAITGWAGCGFFCR